MTGEEPALSESKGVLQRTAAYGLFTKPSSFGENMVKTIEWLDDKVIMLDQSRLPLEVVYIECRDYLMVAEGIKKLWIRGAPAIGIAAAMAIALAAQEIEAVDHEGFMGKLEPVFTTLTATRPTAVNIQWAVARIRAFLKARRHEPVATLRKLLIEEALEILKEDIEVNKAIGRWGAQFIHDGDTVLTHCNAGSLATGGYGTATAPMLIAKEQGKKFQVIADETRPVLQGARLTAWELMQADIPVTLITDNSAGALMQRGEISLAIVGTDRTVLNGDVANKIGTYSVAVLCREHGIPFYVAAPMSSIDFSIACGDLIPIEERSADEVTHIFGSCRIAPEGVKVRNLAFDVTPAKFVTAIITEKGAFRPRDIKKLADDQASLEKIRIRE
jgi:methylthioribose-1-phosphate isomerase